MGVDMGMVVPSSFGDSFEWTRRCINSEALRCHGDRMFRPTVALVLRNQFGEWLLAQSAKRHIWYTIQGGIDPREDVLDALFRETWEECGIRRQQLQVQAFIGKGFKHLSHVEKKGFRVGKRYFFFLVDYHGPRDLVIERSELAQIHWLRTPAFVSALSHRSRQKYQIVIDFFNYDRQFGI
jgi:putative (di)nucleoside polyphosphate hydrolase